MVNLVTVYCSLLHWFTKMVGLRPHMVEIEPGTVMRFWVPSETVSNSNKRHQYPNQERKPALVLLHGFVGDGIMNWQLQVGAFTKKYEVYVPDLLFFGCSTTDKAERSPSFQAECLVAGLRKLGVKTCIVVGFSYGGMVGFKMAELYPEMVQAIVISGSVVPMMDSIILKVVQGVGFSSCSDMLMPTSVKGVKHLLSLGAHKKLSFPNRLYSDFLQVMFTNKKERGELLEALVISYKEINIPNLPQQIHLVWGENDKIFKPELAQTMKEKLGDKATFEGIKKAGHLVHMERPLAYNRCLKQFLCSVLPNAKT